MAPLTHISTDVCMFLYLSLPNRSGEEWKTALEGGNSAPRHNLRRNCCIAAIKERNSGETDTVPPYSRGRCLRNQELYILTVDRQIMIPTHSISTVVHRMAVKHPAKMENSVGNI